MNSRSVRRTRRLRIASGNDKGNAWSMCTTTAAIEGRGTLVASGLAELLNVETSPGGFGVAPQRAEFAVVGGTGAYAGARGQVPRSATRDASHAALPLLRRIARGTVGGWERGLRESAGKLQGVSSAASPTTRSPEFTSSCPGVTLRPQRNRRHHSCARRAQPDALRKNVLLASLSDKSFDRLPWSPALVAVAEMRSLVVVVVQPGVELGL